MPRHLPSASPVLASARNCWPLAVRRLGSSGRPTRTADHPAIRAYPLGGAGLNSKRLALAGAGGADPCIGAGVSALRRYDQKDRRGEQLDGRGCGEMGFSHVLSCFAAFLALPVG